jgi:hypothetical protein
MKAAPVLILSGYDNGSRSPEKAWLKEVVKEVWSVSRPLQV